MEPKKHLPSATVTRLAKTHLERGDALGWFEEVYRVHRDEPGAIPWADFAPNDLLVSWLDANAIHGRACVVGCGLGDDAAEIALRGARVTAFDLSPTAIELARERFANSPIQFEPADLFALPAEWRHAFDFIFEAYTLQSLPARIRHQAFLNVVGLLAPGGRLVVVARLRNEQDAPPETPPWPLTRAELAERLPEGVRIERDEEFAPSDKHPSRRIRVTYRRDE